MLEHELPTSLPKTHFRLVKDYINRYVYPHMRPDLKPAGYAAERLWGFHAQHKDAIEDYPDASARDLLREAFRPSAGEVIIDGGAFLGFGEIRLAPDIRGGRIIAIEANPDCHALLVRNLTHNRVDGVTALHAAVWERRGIGARNRLCPGEQLGRGGAPGGSGACRWRRSPWTGSSGATD